MLVNMCFKLVNLKLIVPVARIDHAARAKLPRSDKVLDLEKMR